MSEGTENCYICFFDLFVTFYLCLVDDPTQVICMSHKCPTLLKSLRISYEISKILKSHIFRRNCTYCSGDIEDNYPPTGILLAILLFPIGKEKYKSIRQCRIKIFLGILVCCMLRERQCVKCNKSSL